MEPTGPSAAAAPLHGGWAAFPRRVLQASLLHVDTYEEVEADRSATTQAFVVVLLASAAGGIGGFENHGVAGVVWHTLHGVLLWGVWAWVTSLIGTRWLPTDATESDWGELLRTIGFSSAPGLIRVLGLYPPITLTVFVISFLWMLVAMVVAVRQALDYTSTWRAIAVCAIGSPIYVLGSAVSIVMLGPWPV